MSTQLSVHPAASFHFSAIVSAFIEGVRKLLPQAAPVSVSAAVDTSDIWALYRMTGSGDSVPHAVTEKLSQRSLAE
jgi:hypothetical protein